MLVLPRSKSSVLSILLSLFFPPALSAIFQRLFPLHGGGGRRRGRRADGKAFFDVHFTTKVLTKACKSVTTGPYSLYAPPCDPYLPFRLFRVPLFEACAPRPGFFFRFDTFCDFFCPANFCPVYFQRSWRRLRLPVRNNGHFINASALSHSKERSAKATDKTLGRTRFTQRTWRIYFVRVSIKIRRI